ncbi:MAG: hypothetical protein J2P21_20425 [Chloracidobacterium sp.]|nr:hypothetical protein [Chloracidobacterium sp.]
MIIWGRGGDVVNLGVLETRRCEVCEKDRPFNIILQYRYFGFYWVFNFVTQRKYLLLCSVCSRGWELDSAKVEPGLAKTPIPFMRRYGILVLIVAIVGILGMFSIAAAVGGAVNK